jgi:hypothetical protein
MFMLSACFVLVMRYCSDQVTCEVLESKKEPFTYIALDFKKEYGSKFEESKVEAARGKVENTEEAMAQLEGPGGRAGTKEESLGKELNEYLLHFFKEVSAIYDVEPIIVARDSLVDMFIKVGNFLFSQSDYSTYIPFSNSFSVK